MQDARTCGVVTCSGPYCFDGIYREVETAHIVQNTFITPASPIVYGFIHQFIRVSNSIVSVYMRRETVKNGLA